MRSLAAVLSFRPSKLTEARVRLAEVHPATRSRPRTIGPAERAVLRVRVSEAAGAPDPERELRALSYDLFERELLAVVRALGQWADLRNAVVTMARERPLRRYVPVLWRSWQAFPALEPMVELLKENVKRFGMTKAVADAYHDDATGWLREDHPVDAIVCWAGARKIAWDTLPSIPDSPFDLDTPLIKEVFHRTLQIGSREQLLGMEEDTILEGWKQMSGDAHMQACANFLERVPSAKWSNREEALDEVRESYGIPPKPETTTTVAAVPESVPVFWKRVSEERREEFRQHFIRLELAFAFRGDSTPDRRRFWMDQRRHIVSVGRGTAGTTPFCVIVFPGFSVIEFFELGNAAYLYPSDHFIAQRWSSPESRARAPFPSELKSRTREFRPPGDNRIIHRGRWQDRARRILKRWREHYP